MNEFFKKFTPLLFLYNQPTYILCKTKKLLLTSFEDNTTSKSSHDRFLRW